MTPANITGVVIGAEWSPNLAPGSWQELPDTGAHGEHRFVIPESPTGRGFMRLMATEADPGG